VSGSIEDAKIKILNQVPLTALIAESVDLERRSGRQVACCPFHQEKTPSFTIYEQHYYCFGCKASGDAIDFVRHKHGLGFIEALRHLAEKYGIEAPELNRNDHARHQRQQSATMFQALAKAQQHFVDNLNSHVGKNTREYLIGRGFSNENIDNFGFGFAIDSFDSLKTSLTKQGYHMDILVSCSLAGRSESSGRSYDFFRNRLMIPIRDVMGRTIGFGGRTMGDDPRKYINSRETVLFDKSRVLFGIERAKDAARQAGTAIVTEGYMDALQLWQQGFPNTVACLGTALTKHHLQGLAAFSRRCILLFDGDSSGIEAAMRSITSALEISGIEVMVASLPHKEDPDSFVLANGQQGLMELLEKAKPILDYVIDQKLENEHLLAVPELVRKEFLPWISQLNDPLRRDIVLRRLASRTGIAHQALTSELTRFSQDSNHPRQAASKQITRLPKPERMRHLNTREVEWLGHLFFARPEPELHGIYQQLLLLVENQAVAEVWHEFASELWRCIAADKSPFEQPAEFWESASETLVSDLIESLKRSQPAFELDNPRLSLTKLINAYRAEEKRTKIKRLKHQLLKRPSSEHQELLQAITQLNSELISLEKDVNSIGY